jgi:hypothetical protein
MCTRHRFTTMDRDEEPERPPNRFDPFARAIEWYRLPMAIKLAFVNLWRVDQDAAKPAHEPTKNLEDR